MGKACTEHVNMESGAVAAKRQIEWKPWTGKLNSVPCNTLNRKSKRMRWTGPKLEEIKGYANGKTRNTDRVHYIGSYRQLCIYWCSWLFGIFRWLFSQKVIYWLMMFGTLCATCILLCCEWCVLYPPPPSLFICCPFAPMLHSTCP